MKVLLHNDIDGLGYLGDVVEVSDGYARNYLLPQKLAVQPTEANIKAIQKERAQKAEIRRLAREKLLQIAEQVENAAVSISALTNEQGHLFGSIGPAEISQALKKKGFEIQNKQVRLPEHIRQLGEYEVKLHFTEGIDATIQLEVVLPTEQKNGEQKETGEQSE